jgi:ABC-type nickel/cobalt efflux system permease component RcnA
MSVSVLGILGLGLVIGMQHALEADHVAAVSAIAVRQRNMRRIVAHGAVWGAGHTITLMLFAGAAVIAGAAISETMAGWLEFSVGAMLLMLGLSVIWRMWRDRVHFHLHSHGDGVRHFHAHSHAGEAGRHDPKRHKHSHRRGAMARTLIVGMIHGMAGSAALLVLTAAAAPSPAVGIAYIAIFGIGSIAGMALLSAAIAVPLTWTARYLTAAHNGLQLVVGSATAGLGLLVMADKWSILGL